MLGWLLDPSKSHGLGGNILRRFLYAASKLAREDRIDFGGVGRLVAPLDAETYSLSDLAIHPEHTLPTGRRLDLLLLSRRERWLCLIENKILSDEGEEQTTDYYAEVLNSFPPEQFSNRLFIYLSPEGARPQSRHFVRISYSTVTELLQNGSTAASAFGRIAIDQYVRCLWRRVVEREQLQDICVKLYRNHKAA